MDGIIITMAAEEGKEGDGKAATVIKVLIILVVALFVLAKVVPKPTTETVMYGVKVVSEFPLEKLRSAEYIALYNTTATPAELTCKFELSAISKPDPGGYRIRIEEGETGIYLKDKEAYIKGATQGDMLRACHVFACLRDGVTCPNFDALDDFLGRADHMSLILDSKAGQASGRGYAEIMGGLSYLQSKKADVDNATFFIYPFLMKGETCEPQPLNNLVQNLTRSNETFLCSDIAPAIILAESNESAIRVVGDQVFVSGSDDQVHTGAIIVRDYIAPEWVRRLYGFD
jgi:hypothetical protein